MNTGRHVYLKVAPHGKGGERVYKFGIGCAHLLKARGWDEVKRTKSYIFLRAPDSEHGGPPFLVEADIPTREQVMELAQEAHARGQAWAGRVGEWIAWYSPPQRGHIVYRDPFTGVEAKEEREFQVAPHFGIGTSAVWDAHVCWWDGTPHYSEQTRNTVPNGESQLSLFQSADLYEGALHRVELNEYEHDPTARRLCIAHHGAVCGACGFNFEKFYGAVAEGFIHVHHLVPISQAGGEYRVDPINDLVPVCPNCHSVIHLRNPPYSIAELKAFIRQRESPAG